MEIWEEEEMPERRKELARDPVLGVPGKIEDTNEKQLTNTPSSQDLQRRLAVERARRPGRSQPRPSDCQVREGSLRAEREEAAGGEGEPCPQGAARGELPQEDARCRR